MLNFYICKQKKVKFKNFCLKEPLFDNSRLDTELRTMLRERFAIFVNKEEIMGDVMVVNADDLVRQYVYVNK